MYCESCGRQIDETLNYCNSCGAQLRRDNPPPRSLTGIMIASLAFITIVGLIVLASLLIGLLDRMGPKPEPLFAFAALYLVALFGICFLIMRQVSKLIDAELRSRDIPKRTSATPPLVQLPPKSTNPLDEFREPATVTDHTTRTLEPTPLKER